VPRIKQRTPALRERLVRAAVDTLAEHGPAGFTTRRVAACAATSVPAVYELFGDKAGLVREVFFEGFRRLGDALAALPRPAGPRADLERAIHVLRRFTVDNVELAGVMFGRPFTAFDPGPAELAAGAAVREAVLSRVRRCVESGALAGDPVDIAHVLLALVQGLAGQQAAGWLGTSRASVNRRWALGCRAVLDGFRPAP
jgi:AcrR family transcriptional regulator